MKYFVLLITLLFACGQDVEFVDERNDESEVRELREQILKLQGTVLQIDAFVANDFSDCDNGLPPFETKICEIAQTATAEQRLEIKSQLSEIAKVFQDEMYGEDCVDDVEVGCPVVGSILEKLTLANDIPQLQLDVISLQSDMLSIENRLDNFNGTGNSIETVIVAIENDIVLIKSRLDDLENVVNSGDVYKTISVCHDIVNSGPIYEAVLMTGDKTQIVSYIQSGTKKGLASIAQAGVTGDFYDQTTLNTRRCKFNVYDLTTELKMCWNNTNRNSSQASIDTECDSVNNFLTPSADCTCY